MTKQDLPTRQPKILSSGCNFTRHAVNEVRNEALGFDADILAVPHLLEDVLLCKLNSTTDLSVDFSLTDQVT